MNFHYFRHAVYLVVLATMGGACGRDPLEVSWNRDAAVPLPDAAENAGDDGPDAHGSTDGAASLDASTGPQLPVDGKCPEGLSPCGHGEALRCYDLSRTSDHCGTCAQTCAAGISCQAGACQQHHCNGPLTFKALPTTSIPISGLSYGPPALGDFDGDSIVDLVGVPDAAGAISLLYGAGDGTFPTHQVIEASPAVWPQALAVDVDGDGLLDLTNISASTGTLMQVTPLPSLSVRRGLGTRNAPFEAPTIYPTGEYLFLTMLADFDADGRPELVTGFPAGFEYRRGQAGGQFAAPTTLTSRDGLNLSSSLLPSVSIMAADWNGDHMLDLVYMAGGSLHFRLGHGDGTFDAEVACALGMGVVGDVDHDGRVDLISGANLLLGIDTCNPKKTVALADWPRAGNSALADLDGDGNLDIVAEAKVTVRLGDGKGGFTKTVSLPGVGTDPWGGSFLFADLNRDGKLDVVYTQQAGWGVFLNTCK